MMKILLLEDDEILATTLQELLELEGFEVVHTRDGEEALQVSYTNSFDIFLFDVNVAMINGFGLLESLREAGVKTPAIFITALSDIASLSRGFAVGADDYIKKPFDFDELVVRLHAVVRKSFAAHTSLMKVGNFTYDIEKNELYKEDKFIKLPPMELLLVKQFFKDKERTIPKEELLYILGEGKEMSESSLRVHINKLRKIGLPIETIKGVGYRLITP